MRLHAFLTMFIFEDDALLIIHFDRHFSRVISILEVFDNVIEIYTVFTN